MEMESRHLAEMSIDLGVDLISTGCCPSTSPQLVFTSVAWYVNFIRHPFQMICIIQVYCLISWHNFPITERSASLQLDQSL